MLIETTHTTQFRVHAPTPESAAAATQLIRQVGAKCSIEVSIAAAPLPDGADPATRSYVVKATTTVREDINVFCERIEDMLSWIDVETTQP